jgi:hypothetical protein
MLHLPCFEIGWASLACTTYSEATTQVQGENATSRKAARTLQSSIHDVLFEDEKPAIGAKQMPGHGAVAAAGAQIMEQELTNADVSNCTSVLREACGTPRRPGHLISLTAEPCRCCLTCRLFTKYVLGHFLPAVALLTDGNLAGGNGLNAPRGDWAPFNNFNNFAQDHLDALCDVAPAGTHKNSGLHTLANISVRASGP